MDTLTAPSPARDKASSAGLIAARLTAIVPVAKDTNLYTFRRAEGGSLPSYAPGAHIDLYLPNGMIRQFSLCVPNTDPETYVVGIKRDPESRGGSRYIFDEMRVGHEINISAPRNNFPLTEGAEPIVLVAGGIGITPVWCMAQELAARQRPWKLYYSCRTRDEMAFLETLQNLGPESVHLHFDDEAGGIMRRSIPISAAGLACPGEAARHCPHGHLRFRRDLPGPDPASCLAYLRAHHPAAAPGAAQPGHQRLPLCRIADTIEDQTAPSAAATLVLLQRFVAVVRGIADAAPLVEDLLAQLSPDTSPAERDLVRNARSVVRFTAALEERPRRAIRALVDGGWRRRCSASADAAGCCGVYSAPSTCSFLVAGVCGGRDADRAVLRLVGGNRTAQRRPAPSSPSPSRRACR